MNHVSIAFALLSIASRASAEYTQPESGGGSDGCVDFGIASSFNGVFYDHYQGSSDIQGTIAVGGNAVFSDGYSVADQVVDELTCSDYSVVVKGSLSFKQGQNYGGSIVVGVESEDPIPADKVMKDCGVDVNPSVDPQIFDFAKSKQEIEALSQELASLPSTVKEIEIDVSKRLTVEFDGTGDKQVMFLDENDLDTLVDFFNPLIGVPAGHLIVFNIRGSAPKIQGINMEALKDYPVIFNLFQATSATIRELSLEGALIAPGASIENAMGVIQGPTYAGSMTGPIQINLRPVSCAAPKSSCGAPKPQPKKCRPRKQPEDVKSASDVEPPVKCRKRKEIKEPCDDAEPKEVKGAGDYGYVAPKDYGVSEDVKGAKEEVPPPVKCRKRKVQDPAEVEEPCGDAQDYGYGKSCVKAANDELPPPPPVKCRKRKEIIADVKEPCDDTSPKAVGGVDSGYGASEPAGVVDYGANAPQGYY